MSRAFTPTVGGLYSLGNALSTTLGNGLSIQSNILNAQDLGNVGAGLPDFGATTPGSQVWYIDYAIIVLFPETVPTDLVGIILRVLGSATIVGATFFTEQEIRLPLSGTAGVRVLYSGKTRVEWVATMFTLTNETGQDVVLSYQFWAKSF